MSIKEYLPAFVCSRLSLGRLIGLRVLAAVIVSVIGCLRAEADNYVMCTPSDSVMDGDVPVFIGVTRNNETRVSRHKWVGPYFYDMPDTLYPSDGMSNWSVINFRLMTLNERLRIDSVQWILRDKDGSILFSRKPLQSFSLDSVYTEVGGSNSLMWDIHIEYPYFTTIYHDEELLIYTDKGVIKEFIEKERRMERELERYNEEYEIEVRNRESETRMIIIWSVVAGVILVVAAVALVIVIRIRLRRKRDKVRMLSMLVAEHNEKSRELEEKVSELYGSRLDTLNLLCNKYFESRGFGEDVTDRLFGEIEKHILSIKSPKNLQHLEQLVDRYLNDIMAKVRVQIPELDRKDLTFLTYLYAGFSPRAVCIFADIKMQNFYKRRERLRDRILASGASDRELFVSKMGF